LPRAHTGQKTKVVAGELTDIGAAKKTRSQSDVTMPVGRMYTHVASNKRRLEKLLAFL